MEKLDYVDVDRLGEMSTSYTLNFKKKTISVDYETTVKIKQSDLSLVREIKDKALSDRKKQIDDYEHRMLVTETYKEPILNGYRIIEPLSEEKKQKLFLKIQTIREEINFLENLKPEDVL